MRDPSSVELVCLVLTGAQRDAARRLEAAHDGVVLAMLPGGDLASPSSSGIAAAHIPAVTPSLIVRTCRALRAHVRRSDRRVVLVVAQDVGVFERAVIAQARRSDAGTVLLPDGIVTSERFVGSGLRTAAIDVVDRGLAVVGLLAGRRAAMGSSRPDLCLSWGPGWRPVWDASRVATADVGAPRLDGLGVLPAGTGGLLVCSQPTWLREYGGEPSAAAWYGWIDALAASPQSRGSIRVRLHPVERDRHALSRLSPAARTVVSDSADLADDLRWSMAVVAPPSTVLVEAILTGRPAVCVAATPSIAALASTYPVFGNAGIPIVGTADVRDVGDVESFASLDRAALQSRFACNLGRATEAALEAIVDRFGTES